MSLTSIADETKVKTWELFDVHKPSFQARLLYGQEGVSRMQKVNEVDELT